MKQTRRIATLMIALAATGAIRAGDPLAIEGRTAPPWGMAPVGMADYWQPSFVGRDGSLRYRSPGPFDGYGIRITAGLTRDAETIRQELVAPGVPIVRTVSGVTLHSYRYAWAERARKAGVPERFAQEALGHNSSAVHRAYAKNAQVKVPSLEEYERECGKKKVVAVRFRAGNADGQVAS